MTTSNQHPLTAEQMNRIVDLAMEHSAAIRNRFYTGSHDYSAEDAAWNAFTKAVVGLTNPDELLQHTLTEARAAKLRADDYYAPADPASLLETDCCQ